MYTRTILCCLFVALGVTPAAAAETSRTLSVTGQGTATAPPDTAMFDAGVVTQAPTAAQALESNNEAAQRMIEVLKEAQIADKDIQTSRIDISPIYSATREGREPKITGYQVTNQVRVVVRSLPSLGRVLDAVVRSGSNQLGGIRFDIDNKTGVLNQARNRAMQDARARAELYAQAAGVKVGRVLTIQEAGGVVPEPRGMMRFAVAAEAAVPVAPGEQELAASVNVTYELLDQ
jgi:uncharacterized protein YggE